MFMPARRMHPATPVIAAWGVVAALGASALLAVSGAQLIPSAHADGTPKNVVVTATVATVLEVNVPASTCGTAQNPALTINIATTTVDELSPSAQCLVTYGSSNDTTTFLKMRDADGTVPFLAGSIANTTAACGTLVDGAADQQGVKTTAASASSTPACAVSTAGSTLGVSAMPTTATTVCSSAIASTSLSCTFQWVVYESNGDAALTGGSTHAGTAEFSVTAAP